MDLNIPIQQKDNKLVLTVSTNLYSIEAISASIYNFSGEYYIFQQPSKKSESVDIFFESKEGNQISEEVAKSFCNDLADQQMRYLTEKEFGYIRDLIVEEAFKPVNK